MRLNVNTIVSHTEILLGQVGKVNSATNFLNFRKNNAIRDQLNRVHPPPPTCSSQSRFSVFKEAAGKCKIHQVSRLLICKYNRLAYKQY